MNDQLQIPFDRRHRKRRPVVVLTTNRLTTEIIAHIRKLGGWATRVNVSGFYDPEKEIWRKGVTDPGTPDILALVNGRFFGIEVKNGSDRLRPEQITTRQMIQSSGGLYLIAHNLAQFREDMRRNLT